MGMPIKNISQILGVVVGPKTLNDKNTERIIVQTSNDKIIKFPNDFFHTEKKMQRINRVSGTA